MTSTQIHRDTLDDVTVSTTLIEPFGYYEVALLHHGYVEVLASYIENRVIAGMLHLAALKTMSTVASWTERA
jgi:hypothetical protein